MLVTEFTWRVKSCLTKSPHLQNVFGQFESSFSSINATNFRESIHSFIMLINQRAKIPMSKNILHVKFTSFICNGVKIEGEGWLDINQDTLVACIIHKSIDLPDVFVFRFSQICENSTSNKTIRFTTKEKLIAFEKITTKKPLKFQFLVENCPKSIQTEFSKRCTQFQQNLKMEHQQTTIKPKLPERKQQKRIYASKKDEIFITNPIIQKENALEITKPDKNKEKEMSIKKIESILGIYQQQTFDSINGLEAQINAELQDIISRVKDHHRVLLQLSQQHQQVTNSTSKENDEIAKNVSVLENDFQTRHNETIQKRDSISKRVIHEIDVEKQKFIKDTNDSIEQNAIVYLANNLGSLQDIMCESQPFPSI
ncbi:hypothetical protein GPJ56_010803 [Histomonas meleagridis]|uniref:uncharacterized protein n=1 Tax=Histomonas meleagridis TaxID=135588 RepID=UPI00355A0474|nr:hypothetical protein GPJ56_010803 [Histomonas meleagridis]KAH0801140.1 hypothetical protein GO595_006175 [Histomonas meleagridis]